MPAERFEILLMLIAAVIPLELAARRLRFPPSAMLTLGGIAIALVPGAPEIEVDPDLMLVLFLPPLLFSSAYFTVWRDFKADLRVILQLAIGAVAFTTLAVGVVAHAIVPGLPWAACFALGAVVSPPDAVAAKAALQGLPLPRRLVTLLEGESLVNDATGLVLYRLAIAAGLTGAFNVWSGAAEFAFLAAGGVAVGVALGFLGSSLLERLDNVHLNIVAGFLGAFASYIVGEQLHVSGVLSTVCCGLVLGQRQHRVFPALTRVQATAVWQVAIFLLESLVFILIGLSLRPVLHRLGEAGVEANQFAPAIGVILLAMTAARFAWILATAYISRFLIPSLRARDPYPPLAVPIIMSWAGMRGVVSLAVALSVPAGFPGRDFIMAATMAAILASILIQGTTLRALVKALQPGDGFALNGGDHGLSRHEAHARILAAEAKEIEKISRQPDGSELHPRLLEQYGRRASVAQRFVDTEGALAADRLAHYEAILAANRAGRAELLRLHRSGEIHDLTLHALEAEIDIEELGARKMLDR
ncbi:Na+/H+ antiporter [Methylocella silvestris]|uniref:Na+/H+ antiporter n=1 Tax=Methylocella silvestris TaxID=199596 RepID=A0A2J7TGR9_METSI|nr:Na+/H+ antiporter [Methylocella silvestris]PNG25963.1 Na+/H+ antiporter [Methylocella silvestris]